jgi:riboflavin kinase / FMN adenylyltransferase
MKVIHDLSQMPSLEGSVVTDGMFDGVHLGHQSILQQVSSLARSKGLSSVLLTYWPHPRHVLAGKEARIPLLTSLEEKARLVEAQGIDYMLVIAFSKTFSEMSHERFVREILAEGLHTKALVVGYDHRFGQNRLGDVAYLNRAGQEYGFSIVEIGKQEVDAITISSTKIRYALQNFLVDSARSFLGRPYSVSGTVVKGDQRGRAIGFPTANLQPDEPAKLIPADGVYATRTKVGQDWFPSMTNIGFRPTVDGRRHTLETHLIDFQDDLYGQTIEVAFWAPLRQEIRFSGLEALKEQLLSDKKQSLILLEASGF